MLLESPACLHDSLHPWLWLAAQSCRRHPTSTKPSNLHPTWSSSTSTSSSPPSNIFVHGCDYRCRPSPAHAEFTTPRRENFEPHKPSAHIPLLVALLPSLSSSSSAPSSPSRTLITFTRSSSCSHSSPLYTRRNPPRFSHTHTHVYARIHARLTRSALLYTHSHNKTYTQIW